MTTDPPVASPRYHLLSQKFSFPPADMTHWARGVQIHLSSAVVLLFLFSFFLQIIIATLTGSFP